jgi:glutamate carboxypeptidase
MSVRPRSPLPTQRATPGWRVAAILAAGLLLAGAAQAAQPGLPNNRLLQAVRSCDADARALLERAVAIDSGTGYAEGLDAMGKLYGDALAALGGEVRVVEPTPPSQGHNVVVTYRGQGKGRILLITHIDTVFTHASFAAFKPRWEGNHFIAPGAGDDKSGGVTALCALRALKQLGFRDYARIDVLLNASEEIGSPGSRELMRALARDSDLTLNLERGVPTDGVVVARKGASALTMEFKGRAAHSGLEPEKGRNAALEAARVALLLGSLADAAKQTTVVVDQIHGGDKTNVVPEQATVKADVRALSAAEFERVEHEAAAIAARPGIEGVTITSLLEREFPPWPRSAATEQLLERIRPLFGELGRTLTTVEVGSSADVSIAAETGTASLDGFGLEGGGAHTNADYADLASLVPRSYVLARTLMEFGHNPH